VEPGETVEVQVMLQAMKEEPPLSTKCKDKFLIQSTIITADKETLPLHDIWNNVDPETPVQSQKIRVVYLPPEGQTVPEEEEPQANEAPAPAVPAPVPESKLYQTAPRAANGGAPPIPDFDETRNMTAAEIEQHDYEETQEDMPAADSAPVVNVAVHPPPRDPSPAPQRIPSRSHDEDLDGKLHEANAEINRLRALLATMPEPSKATSTQVSSEPELRRRHRPASTVIGSETDVSSYVDEPLQPDGVPLQIVIIIALGVFVTTYLFF